MEKQEKSAYWQALGLAWELGYLIVLPLVIFALAGRFVDQHYGTSPWMLLAGLVLSIIITTFLLIKKFSHLVHDIEKQSKS